jgi:hypothetical protein
MRKWIVFSTLCAMVILMISLPTSGQEKEFTIARLVVGTGVENKEPVGVAETFPATTEKVYCFVEATEIPKDTEISFVWLYGEKEMLKTNLPLQAGPKWRTFANKNTGGLKGDWKVEIRDSDGKVVKFDGVTRTLLTKGVQPRSIKMSWRYKLLDTISNPTIAYILLMLGIYGVFFELSNPGAILPGVVGGIFLILAFYALQMLPVNFAGLALILFAIILFIAEIKVCEFQRSKNRRFNHHNQGSGYRRNSDSVNRIC